MPRYNGHEVTIEEQYGQSARITADADGKTINQEGTPEGGWVRMNELEEVDD